MNVHQAHTTVGVANDIIRRAYRVLCLVRDTWTPRPAPARATYPELDAYCAQLDAQLDASSARITAMRAAWAVEDAARAELAQLGIIYMGPYPSFGATHGIAPLTPAERAALWAPVVALYDSIHTPRATMARGVKAAHRAARAMRQLGLADTATGESVSDTLAPDSAGAAGDTARIARYIAPVIPGAERSVQS